MGSIHHSMSLPLLPSQGEALTLFLCSHTGSSMGCRWVCAPDWSFLGCGWLRTGCRGIPAPDLGAPPLIPAAWPGDCRAVALTYPGSSLWLMLCTACPFLNLGGTATIADGLCLGQQQVCLGLSWLWLCWTGGKLLEAPHRSHPCNPPSTKTLPCKPNTIPLRRSFGQSSLW